MQVGGDKLRKVTKSGSQLSFVPTFLSFLLWPSVLVTLFSTIYSQYFQHLLGHVYLQRTGARKRCLSMFYCCHITLVNGFVIVILPSFDLLSLSHAQTFSDKETNAQTGLQIQLYSKYTHQSNTKVVLMKCKKLVRQMNIMI